MTDRDTAKGASERLIDRYERLVAAIIEWLAEEDRQAVEARAAAESYRRVDSEACVDISRSANRHENTARRIRRVLMESDRGL